MPRLKIAVLTCLTGLLFSSVPDARQAQDKRTGSSKPMAIVNGVPVTENDLKKAGAAELEMLEVQRAQYEISYARSRHQILQRTLDKVVEARLFAAEAARLKISEKELLSREVEGKVKQPTEKDVEAFYETNKTRIQQPIDKVRPQVRKYLEEQAYSTARNSYVQQLKKQYPVVTYLEPLRSNVHSTGHPSRGPENARVTLVEFSEFECAYCRTMYATLKEVLKNYPDNVRLVFRQYPLTSIHRNAQKAAEAALCAGEQQRFWEMHDTMFDDPKNIRVDDLKAKAAKLNLDTGTFNACLDSGRQADAVKRDLKEGSALGVSGTPALFINGRFLSGAQPYAELARIIDEELSLVTKGAAKKQ